MPPHNPLNSLYSNDLAAMTKQQTEFTQQDYQVIQNQWERLWQMCLKRCPEQDQLDLIRKAYDFASTAHKGIRRRSGEPYILHPIAVANIVVDKLGLGCKSICAALLHDVVEDSDYTSEDIQSLFGDKIARLVDGLTKIKTVLDNEDGKNGAASLQAENFKRILLTLNEDVRVVLIKLADRLHNCRTIEYMPDYKREKILSETMYLFIPLAHKLGLYEIKSEMENIWLRYKEPEAYREVLNFINSDTFNKDALIEDFLVPIREALDKAGIEYYIKKRVKTPYSIWHKVRTKNVTMDQISDLYAVRIIFQPHDLNLTDERNECFHIFSLITAIYDYRPDRVRDWVMHPKSNGYEALHLTALTKDHRTSVEVQIRSKRMDDIAEQGIAAHWNYKKLMPQTEVSQMDKWIGKIKEALDDPQMNSVELLDMIHNDLLENDIFVFDSKGNEYSITKGATALDFGYLVNPEQASHAIAAKVNYRLCSLSHTLNTGDQVEIISSRQNTPKAEWLHFLRTTHALQQVSEYLGIKQKTNDISNDEYVIASCCNPIPGDQVVGFRTDDGKIEIHKKSCPHADSLASKYGERIVRPKWVVDTYAAFPVRLQMIGIDRMGLMHEISGSISKEKRISFKSINIHTHDGIFEGYMDIWVHDVQTLDSVVELLSSIEGIQNIKRTEIL